MSKIIVHTELRNELGYIYSTSNTGLTDNEVALLAETLSNAIADTLNPYLDQERLNDLMALYKKLGL